MISMVTKTRRIKLLRITFSPSDLDRPQVEPAVIFSYIGPRGNQHMVIREQEPGEGIPGAAGILSPAKADSCYFYVKPAKNENDFYRTRILRVCNSFLVLRIRWLGGVRREIRRQVRARQQHQARNECPE